MTEKPKPVWVTTEEGGDFIPWEEWQADFRKRPITLSFEAYMNKFRIHSVGFDDGSVFDNMVGWRTWESKDLPLYQPDRELYHKYAGKFPATAGDPTSLFAIMRALRRRGLRVAEE